MYLFFNPLKELQHRLELFGGIIYGLFGAHHGYPVQVKHVAVMLSMLRMFIPDRQVPHLFLA